MSNNFECQMQNFSPKMHNMNCLPGPNQGNLLNSVIPNPYTELEKCLGYYSQVSPLSSWNLSADTDTAVSRRTQGAAPEREKTCSPLNTNFSPDHGKTSQCTHDNLIMSSNGLCPH